MAKFRATATVTISLSKEIEAETQEEADEIANGLALPDLCHACDSAGERDPDQWELNGLDGSPDDIEIESD